MRIVKVIENCVAYMTLILQFSICITAKRRNIKKTLMSYPTLKCGVCEFFGCSRNYHILKDVVLVKFLDITNAVIHNKKEETKEKEKQVPQLVKFILTDPNNYSIIYYINLPINDVESALVAQLVEYLPVEQESSQTSGFDAYGENPGQGAYIIEV